MEPNSQASDTPENRRILEGQLRECYGRVVYSHKTHEKSSDILLTRLSTIKLWQIILSALTTVNFTFILFGSSEIVSRIGIVISTLLLVLNTYTKDYNLGELAQKHKQAANEIWLIRERYLSLLTDLTMKTKSIEQLQVERDKLLESLHSVYAGSPSTTFEAYKKTQDALKMNEEMTFSDEEIDAFLPKELRVVRPSPTSHSQS